MDEPADACTPQGRARLRAFIAQATTVAAPPLTPELRAPLATDATEIWMMTETALARAGLDPPFWAFAWAGGQGLARLLLDRPALVAGRRVLALACGLGLEAAAAARAGAASVLANDLDPVALVAAEITADLNGVTVATRAGDLTAAPPAPFDVVLAADAFYERAAARRLLGWLRRAAAQGALVLAADAGRGFLPTEGLLAEARYVAPTPPALEDVDARPVTVWRVPPG